MKGKPSTRSKATGQRLWRKGDRAKVSILQVFREAHFEHDARRANQAAEDGETPVSRRSLQRRDGVSEDKLRTHLEADLSALMNTIQLGSTVDLDDVPHVRSSIVNYGFRDLSGVSMLEMTTQKLVDTIKQSLLTYEPRLTHDSIDVKVTGAEGNSRQRLSISVAAEMVGDPMDIPLDFDAEVDVGAGKLKMSKLRVQV